VREICDKEAYNKVSQSYETLEKEKAELVDDIKLLLGKSVKKT
jgi:hypothetical protein